MHLANISSRPPIIAESVEHIRNLIDSSVELDECRSFFHVAINVIINTKKVNQHIQDRMCMCLRIDPMILKERDIEAKNHPYGIFFAAGTICQIKHLGRNFVAFHIRFRDIARGGMKIVTPVGMEEYIVANRNLLKETLGIFLDGFNVLLKILTSLKNFSVIKSDY